MGSYPWTLFWDLESWVGAALASTAEGRTCMVNSPEGEIHFSRYKPLFCCLEDEHYVVWHKIPCSSAFRV